MTYCTLFQDVFSGHLDRPGFQDSVKNDMTQTLCIFSYKHCLEKQNKTKKMPLLFSGEAFLNFLSLTSYVVGHTKSVTKSFDSIIVGKHLVCCLVWGRETKDGAYGKLGRQCFRVLVTFKPDLRLFILY